jgi:hypothetical protein
MIQSIKITNSIGDVLDLDLRSSLDDHGLLVFNLTGLGSPKATVSGVSGPTYDGITGEFVRADARHLLLTLAIPARSTAEETAKQKVYDYFPVKEEISFRVITDAKDVYTTAIVESVEMNQFSKVENAVISLYCADPYFLDTLEKYKYGELNAVSKTIAYEGEVPTETYITVVCGDPWSWGGDYESMGTCTIENDRKTQSMVIEFIAFAEGDRYYIDSRVGQKRVIHEDGATHVQTDVTHLVVPTSDWIKLYPGDNVLSVTIAGTYQGPLPNRPDDAYLAAYLPLGDVSTMAPLELHDDKVFTKGGTVGVLAGKVYPRARYFNPLNEAHFSSVDSLDEDLTPVDDFTLIFWGNIVSDTVIRTVLSAMDAGTDGFNIYMAANDDMKLGIKYNGGTLWTVTLSNIVGAWNCVFFWFDKSASIMYAQKNDGTPVSRSSTPGPNSYISVWDIGGKTTTQFLKGQLQSFALYNGLILTSAERDWVYNSGKGRTYAELMGEHELDVLYRPRYQGV